MVIVDSDGGGVDVASTTGGVSGVVGGAEDVASGVGTVEGAARVGGMISVGISPCCTCCACGCYSSCGNSGGASISGAPGGAT